MLAEYFCSWSIHFLSAEIQQTLFSCAFSLCGLKVLLCARREWRAPVEIPPFPFQGRAGEQPSTPGRRAGGGPGGGALTAREGRRGDVPHAPGPSWPTLSLHCHCHLAMKEQYILASFAPQSLFMGYSWHLRNIIPIFALGAKVATGPGSQVVSSGAGVAQIFQKSPALSSGV